MKLKLVKFEDGTFGVRKKQFFSSNPYIFYGKDCDYYVNPVQIVRYCHLTEDDAKSVIVTLTDKGQLVQQNKETSDA